MAQEQKANKARVFCGFLASITANVTCGVPVQRMSISCLQIFGGWNRRYKHSSDVLGCDMTFTVFFPPAATESKPAPVNFRRLLIGFV